MPTNAIAGVGTVFNRQDDNSSAVFNAIAEVNSITGPSMTRDFIDATSLDSTGGYREFIGGFRDGGQVVLNMNFERDGFEQMRLDFASDDAVGYQIVLPDDSATTLDFDAFVTDLPLTISPDDKVTVDVTLKITGEVTLTS
jgi:predicted secreted protein